MTSSAIFTDLYELRMAAAYLRRSMSGPATFSLFVRGLPAERGFLVVAGLADVLTYLEEFHFTAQDVAHLREGLGLPAEAAAALGRLRFTGDVWAVPEGRVVLAGEPLLEVTAPIAEAQLVETALLNILTYQTAIASKAARCRLAAGSAQLIDFAARRTHGRQAALAAARACTIAGYAATSNVEAAHRFGLRAAGTMAHSFIEAFPSEEDAFTAFAADYPTDTVFLVDTYDVAAGVRTAIAVTRRLELPAPIGIRLDSGDLLADARTARRLLDDAGLPTARIVASGGLDEYAVADLLARGAPIDAFGVGTKIGVSADAPALDSAYKLVSYAGRPVMKLSPGKVTLPGPKQVYRRTADPLADIITRRSEPPPPDQLPLLVPVMSGGRRLSRGDADGLVAAAERCTDDLARLPEPARRIHWPVAPVPRISPSLARLRDEVTGALVRRTVRA
ncbi:nicotinate phosphoribosyltransferase [Actinoplanes sp. NPDC049316]|uniref:nicotinate phosphoribosyltransferase n=1 Tax=Actinoplanes sp. NPDC049316 TaxID=3154727 RepID=UPI00343F4945